MTPSQLSRTMNWIAMSIAVSLLIVVAYQFFQRHILAQQLNTSYQFDDLPTLTKAHVSADIEAIVAKHVFGEVPQESTQEPLEVTQEAPKSVPRTRLNIKLTGIIDANSPEKGIAMVEVDRGRTLVVAVGEKIGKTDAILHQVLPGEILVDRGGDIESVKMVRKTLSLAKLDPAQLDSLPQPYAEQRDEQAGGLIEYSSEAGQNYSDQPASGMGNASPPVPIKRVRRTSNSDGSSKKLRKPRVLRNTPDQG